jgi:hypothetical protein
MKFSVAVIVTLFVSISISCDKESNTPTRTFYMGFTPLPYAASLDAVNDTYAKIAANGDIINHHFDNGVPWTEALHHAAFDANIMDDWAFRKQNTPASHKVYVSVAALNPSRNGLANYRASHDNMLLPLSWDSLRFNNEQVKLAYVNYCQRIIDFFHPDYFNMNVEANLFYSNKPSQWSDFLEFHQHVYMALKAFNPGLKIFSSVTGAQMLQGFLDGNDHVQQRLAALQILDYSDLYGLSFYPYLSRHLGNGYPDNTFDQLFSISEKPLAIAETAYPAQSCVINNSGENLSITSDEAKQLKYNVDLLKACEKRKAEFVINFVLRDYDELWNASGAKNDLSIACRDTGLLDELGRERPGFLTWKYYLNRFYKR